MPTPPSAFAAIGEILGQIDPDDIRALDDFFARKFNSFDEVVRSTAFYWALSLDSAPTEEDRRNLRDLLEEHGFRPRTEATAGADAPKAVEEPYA